MHGWEMYNKHRKGLLNWVMYIYHDKVLEVMNNRQFMFGTFAYI